VLAERTERSSPLQEANRAETLFLERGLRAADRPPTGSVADLAGIDASRMRAFYERWYRPDNAVVVAVGDLPVEALEQRVRDSFASWTAQGPRPERPPYGKADETRTEEVVVRQDTGLPLIFAVCRVHSADWARPHDIDRLKRHELQAIWISTLNRRLEKVAASSSPPFVDAKMYANHGGREAETICLAVTPLLGAWERGLRAARAELDRYAAEGPSEDELEFAQEEERSFYRGDLTHAGTRHSNGLASDLIESRLDHDVFATPAEMFRAFDIAVEDVTPAEVKAAFAKDWSGAGPLLFASSPEPLAPDAFKAAWNEPAAGAPATQAAATNTNPWAYTDFGRPGRVVRRETFTSPDFVRLTFQNGVVVNFKSTKFAADSVLVHVRFGSGRRGLPDGSLATASFAAALLKAGGLGRHDLHDIQTLFHESAWDAELAIGADAFVLRGETTRNGLEDQLQILAAYVTDPGFRPSMDAKLPTVLAAGYRVYRSTPSLVISDALAKELAPSLALPSAADLAQIRTADFERLLKPALTTSPLEITIVGDAQEAEVTGLLAKTFGALPRRAPAPPPGAGVWLRFPDTPPPVIQATHDGPPDKAMVAVLWPLYVATPERRREELTLEMTAALLTSSLNHRVRQELGFSYAPTASTVMPDHADQGYLMAAVETSPTDVDRVGAEIRACAEKLARGEVGEEELNAVRAPLLARWAQRERSNAWWMAVLDGSARGDHPLETAQTMETIYASITLADVRKVAAEWLARPPIVVIARSAAKPPLSTAGGAASTAGR
jgi:zinc protease